MSVPEAATDITVGVTRQAAFGLEWVHLERPRPLAACDSLRSSLRCGACVVSAADRTAPFSPAQWWPVGQPERTD